MKGNRLKTLGFALLGGLALLFAGCGQQAAPPQTPPPQTPTTVAVEGLYDISTNTPVDLNNVSGNVIVRAKVALGSVVPDKVQFLLDNNVEYEVAFGVATQGLQTQQATYTFEWNLNTAALNGSTPKYLNGPHTVAVRLVKGGNPVATSTATNVKFKNQDFVLLSLQGNNAKDANNYTWYGGADLTLVATPVLYSGRTAASVLVTPSANAIPNTTIPASGANVTLVSDEQPVSGGQATFTIKASQNSSVEGGIEFTAQVRYADDGTLSPSWPWLVPYYYALDFQAPNFMDYYVNLNGVYANTFDNITSSTSGWLNGQSPITVKATDGGVGGVTYQVQVKEVTTTTVKATLNPGDTLASVPEAGAGAYALQVVNLKDALGNTASGIGASSSFGLDKTKPTLTTTFGANGKVLNGTLGSASTIQGKGTDLGGSQVPGFLSGVLPSASSPGTSGWLVTVSTGGCTYTLNSTGTLGSSPLPTLNNSPQNYTIDPAGSSGSGPTGCTYPSISSSSGDGNYTFTIQVIDEARNVSDPITVSFYWMTQKPVVQFLQSPSGTYSLGGSSSVLVNGAVKVSHPSGKPILKAILYATGASNPNDVQYQTTPSNVDIGNVGSLTFNPDATLPSVSNYYDFSASSANFPFTLQFNATGSFDVVAAGAPEAYDNTGAVDVSNLTNSTSASVIVNP